MAEGVALNAMQKLQCSHQFGMISIMLRMTLKEFLAPTGALEEVMSDLRPSVCLSVYFMQ